jgi:hypothetical protein
MIIYEGPSELDGQPIVAVMTGLKAASRNPKTGTLPQVWVVPAGDDAPHEAVQSGADSSVCGDCPLRPIAPRAEGEGCYVRAFRGPRSVWQAWRNGRYACDDGETPIPNSLRIGAWGDPAAVPVKVWEALRPRVQGRILGYTHQWRQERFASLQRFAMASCEREDDAMTAIARGWRAFLVVPRGKQGPAEMRQCPASKEWIAAHAPMDGLVGPVGDRRPWRAPTCSSCRACDGTARGGGGSVWINVH